MIEHLHNKYSTFHSEESTCELDKSSSSCLIPRGSKKKKKKKEKKRNTIFCSVPDSLLSKFRHSFLKITHRLAKRGRREGGRKGKRGKSDAPNVQFNVDSSDKHTVDSNEWSTRVYLTRLENEKQAETMTSWIDEAKRGIYWQGTMRV